MKCSKSMGTLSALAALLMAPQISFAEEDATAGAEAEPEVVCFNSDRVRNWDGLSDDYLFIEIKSDERYLMTMKSRCFGLKGAQVFAFKDTMRRVCSDDSFTEIVIRDMGSPMRCSIDTFEKVESKAAAEELVAERERTKDVD